MKHLTLAAAVALALVTSGCGSDDAAEEADAAAPAATESSAETEPSTSASAPATGGQNVLNGVVGEESDPDAFVIALTDSTGAPVETLPAGEYTINVNDLSEIHNFHIQGGDVDESTTVPEVGEQTFTVTFAAGEYEAVCDPHPRMLQEFTVT